MVSAADGANTESTSFVARDAGVRPRNQDNAATGASAASVRAISVQFIRFYFRAPIKAFFRTRVDYMGYARAINPRIKANEKWSLRLTTPGLLAHAVKEYGWGFIPKQVIPPMLANVTVGAVLYTAYLQTLGVLYEPASRSSKRIYPPPPVASTFAAGFAAGSIQSLVAAPLDALQVRFDANQMRQGQYSSMWQYARQKLGEIGIRGVFAGWSLSFVKDSLGYGVFFATFETIKSQAYYEFVTNYYGNLNPLSKRDLRSNNFLDEGHARPTLRPHYTVEPTFLLLAGVGASIAQQVVQHPLSKIQGIHYERLETLDDAARMEKPGKQMLQSYYNAYQKTLEVCRQEARSAGSLRRWLFRGFLVNTIRQVPSTSAGLVVFELVRRRYAWDTESVIIEKDGYDILLS